MSSFQTGGVLLDNLFTIAFLVALFGTFRPYINGVKRWHFGLAAFASLILVGIFAEHNDQSRLKAGNGPTATSHPKQAAPQEPPSKWSYSSKKDEMRGGEERYAEVEAINTIDLDFPYGDQRGRILIRKSPQFGFDILVGVPSGQIMCNAYSNSHISVKFDNGPIRRYGCTDASDGSSNMIFVQGAKGFLASLKNSKKVIIEAEFFQNGIQQMTFDTANLKWET